MREQNDHIPTRDEVDSALRLIENAEFVADAHERWENRKRMEALARAYGQPQAAGKVCDKRWLLVACLLSAEIVISALYLIVRL